MATSIKNDLERISFKLNSTEDFKKLKDRAKDFQKPLWENMVDNMKDNYYQNTKQFKPFVQIKLHNGEM